MDWYQKAYQQGLPAATNIAILHKENGESGKLVWWIRRAIAMGDDDAMLELGKCYEAGIGMRKNAKQAAACYRRLLASEVATELGRDRAKRRLARLK